MRSIEQSYALASLQAKQELGLTLSSEQQDQLHELKEFFCWQERDRQREYCRLPISSQAELSCDGTTTQVQALDISPAGCQLVAPPDFRLGAALKLTFDTDCTTHVFVGKIVRITVKGSVTRLGIAFVGPPLALRRLRERPLSIVDQIITCLAQPS